MAFLKSAAIFVSAYLSINLYGEYKKFGSLRPALVSLFSRLQASIGQLGFMLSAILSQGGPTLDVVVRIKRGETNSFVSLPRSLVSSLVAQHSLTLACFEAIDLSKPARVRRIEHA